MTWAVSTPRRRPGDLLTRGDVCHVHATRDAAERCGAAVEGAPDLVRLERISRYVYRVAWSLSDALGVPRTNRFVGSMSDFRLVGVYNPETGRVDPADPDRGGRS